MDDTHPTPTAAHPASAIAAPGLMIVSGMSGSGKSVALNTLEDLGFYCVDNLPADLLPDFVRRVTRGDDRPEKLAKLIKDIGYKPQ